MGDKDVQLRKRECETVMRLINKVNEPECTSTDDREKTDLNVSNTRETIQQQGQEEQHAERWVTRVFQLWGGCKERAA